MKIQDMHLKNYEYIIWDWNGTLLNDRWVCLEIINEILSKYKLKSITDHEYLKLFRFPVIKFYQDIGFDFKKINFDHLAKQFHLLYEKHCLKCELRKDAVKVLKQLYQNEKKQFILSAYPQNKLTKIINFYQIDHFFSEIKGLDDNYAASKVGNAISMIHNNVLDINRAVIVGDTLHDLEVANNISTDCVLITDGHQDETILKSKSKNVITRLNYLIS